MNYNYKLHTKFIMTSPPLIGLLFSMALKSPSTSILASLSPIEFWLMGKKDSYFQCVI